MSNPDLSLHASARRRLETVLGGPGPSLTVLTGARGVGRTYLLRRLLGDVDGDRPVPVRHLGLPLPDPDQRAAFATSLERDLGRAPPGDDPGPPSWGALFDTLAARVDEDRRPRALVLDDAHHILGAGAGPGEALGELWRHVRSRALPLHLVLSGPSPHLPGVLEDRAQWVSEIGARLELELAPAALHEVATLFPSRSPRDRVRTWAVFGGMPSRLRGMDPSASLASDVRRLVLHPEAPLLRTVAEALAGELQSVPRYLSLLAALASGARDWGSLRRACPDFETGSQMAPYLARLEALGLVEVRRSLDAGPRSRNRRYEIVDPFVAFWCRFVLPRLGEIEMTRAGPSGGGAASGSPGAVLGGSDGGGLDAHVRAVLPRGIRRWVEERGDTILPARGRVVGGLWGAGYDLDPAGTLRNGATFYGTCLWEAGPADPGLFDELHGQLRRTRYGFGREARHRVVVSAGGFTPEARRTAARDPWAHAVELEDVVS